MESTIKNSAADKEASQMSKTIYIVAFVLILIFSSVVGIYVYYFHSYVIDTATDTWGQFGDYLGGLLNPIIAIVNTIILAYIALKIDANEKARTRQNLADSMRPFGYFILNDYENQIGVSIKNAGTGPLVITNLLISDSGNKSYKYLIDFMPQLESGIVWSNFLYKTDDFVLCSGESVNLLQLKGDVGQKPFSTSRDNVRKALSSLTLTLTYHDFIGNEMQPAVRSLNFFGRHFNSDASEKKKQ